MPYQEHDKSQDSPEPWCRICSWGGNNKKCWPFYFQIDCKHDKTKYRRKKCWSRLLCPMRLSVCVLNYVWIMQLYIALVWKISLCLLILLNGYKVHPLGLKHTFHIHSKTQNVSKIIFLHSSSIYFMVSAPPFFKKLCTAWEAIAELWVCCPPLLYSTHDLEGIGGNCIHSDLCSRGRVLTVIEGT